MDDGSWLLADLKRLIPEIMIHVVAASAELAVLIQELTVAAAMLFVSPG
jgi:hypothetical protein